MNQKQTKVCPCCGIKKPCFMYTKLKSSNTGLYHYCKPCAKKLALSHSRTKKGLSAQILQNQQRSSKKRNHPKLPYTLEQFRTWLYSQPNFEKLYNNWVKSNYKKNLIPSVDRLDDYKGYSFDNIRLVTWGVNCRRAYKDRRNGVNNKHSIAVKGTHVKTGKVVIYPSSRSASRGEGIKSNSCITKCCKGEPSHKTIGGYRWEYM